MKIKKERMQIYIPTYGRTGVRHKTWEAIPDSFVDRVWFVVKSEEKKYYQDLHPFSNVIVCDKKGVAAARQAALEHSASRKVAFFDDDLLFARRVKDWSKPDNAKLVKATEEDMVVALEWLEEYLDCYAVVGLAQRGGNCGCGKRWIDENCRIMRAFAVDRNVLKELDLRFDAFYFWEDFHIVLSCIEYGYLVAANVDIVQDGVTNAAGGVSTQRNADHMWKVAKRFAKLHPFAKIKVKTHKIGNVDLPDFNIQWKKAFGSKL